MNLFRLKSDKLKSKWRSRLIFGWIGLILLSISLKAKPLRIEVKTAFFYPSEKAFREIYGRGIKYGFDIGSNIWKKLELHLEANYYLKKGKLTFTKEETRLKLLPIGVSLRYVFLKNKINLYGGIGLTYDLFEEKNPLGKVRKDKMGYAAKIGGFKRIKGLKKLVKAFIIDVSINYHYCQMKPAEIKFDVGGLDLSLGLGLEF